MAIELYNYQIEAIEKMKNGSILCGGVGSGKSRTSIAFYYLNVCHGKIKVNGLGYFKKMTDPKDLYIITTAKKRDSLEWEQECAPFSLSTKIKNLDGVNVFVDSWNNIKKYVGVKNAFFIFDEQRLVGAGTWVKSFLKISKNNQWVLLSATPGDTWLDYVPVFVANKFYKNRTEFLRRHAVYNRFTKYPQIEKFVEQGVLLKLKNSITVIMDYKKPTVHIHKTLECNYNKTEYDKCLKERWNHTKNKPIKNASELCYLLRRVVNSDKSRIDLILNLISKGLKKVIIFYNFDYELELLKSISTKLQITISEWNGHKHEEVPKTNSWIYLVQYTAGAEGWNCIETDTIIFYSQNYSYKTMVQSAGRIDRLNTSFKDLYYYTLVSKSSIDLEIGKALKKKKAFNANKFI